MIEVVVGVAFPVVQHRSTFGLQRGWSHVLEFQGFGALELARTGRAAAGSNLEISSRSFGA
jgi:hypothetical protein